MISDPDLGRLRTALASLREETASTIPWEALSALEPLCANGVSFTIDLRAIETLGAPVIVAQPQTASPALASLSPREREVAFLLARGSANKTIARELSISVATVKDHVHRVLSKLGASSRSQVAAIFHNRASL
ncbi:MAG: response regulator transcription factor [Hyphomonadaceae bacterium]